MRPPSGARSPASITIAPASSLNRRSKHHGGVALTDVDREHRQRPDSRHRRGDGNCTRSNRIPGSARLLSGRASRQIGPRHPTDRRAALMNVRHPTSEVTPPTQHLNDSAGRQAHRPPSFHAASRARALPGCPRTTLRLPRPPRGPRRPFRQTPSNAGASAMPSAARLVTRRSGI